jgi:lipopolysaccharide transport system ATP-binding protein
MRRAEITRKFDEIVAFAEVSSFVDTPVKHYSTGMRMRLAFAVAAHLEPEILVVDEVLAVGDAEFQKRCLGKMGTVARSGRTVLFVSHDTRAVQTLCQTAIHLDAGQIVSRGPAADVLGRYLRLNDEWLRRTFKPRPLVGSLVLEDLRLEPQIIPSGGRTSARVEISSATDATILSMCLMLYSMSDTRVAVIDLRDHDGVYRVSGGRAMTVEVDVRRLPLVEGQYKVALHVKSVTAYVDALDLTILDVTPLEHSPHLVPYPAMYRGFVELECSPVRVSHRVATS